MKGRWLACWLIPLVLSAGSRAAAEIRVHDIARLQGQRTNRLMGYGLVVGLPGTGDGEKYLPTMRALARMHERYHAPVLSNDDVRGNNSVALVVVEAEIPENGARAGQTVDVTVSAIGAARSLSGGQLLTTPLQSAVFDENDRASQVILALAGGPVYLPSEKAPTRGLIRAGATLEEDLIYSFIEGDHITLVLDDSHASFNWAHAVARAINHQLRNPAEEMFAGDASVRQVLAQDDLAQALGPKNVIVRIPPYEMPDPARFISSVRETPLFDLPEQVAQVCINRATGSVTFTGNVTISPTLLQVPGVGTVRIGRNAEDQEAAGEQSPVGFDELFQILSTIQVTPEQLIAAVEQLHLSGALHAQLRYE